MPNQPVLLQMVSVAFSIRWAMVPGLLAVGAALAAEAIPSDVAEYIERREVCEHFRQEPWPEGSTPEERERRELIAQQLDRYCTGTDRAIGELKRKYRDNRDVIDRLERYEADIEARH